MGCCFYIAFTQVEGTIYRCSGINSTYVCKELRIVMYIIEIRMLPSYIFVELWDLCRASSEYHKCATWYPTSSWWYLLNQVPQSRSIRKQIRALAFTKYHNILWQSVSDQGAGQHIWDGMHLLLGFRRSIGMFLPSRFALELLGTARQAQARPGRISRDGPWWSGVERIHEVN